jgi:signal transduction histidine kinase
VIRFAEQQLPANPLPFKVGKGLTSMNERAAAFNGRLQSRFEEGQLITELIMPLAVL